MVAIPGRDKMKLGVCFCPLWTEIYGHCNSRTHAHADTRKHGKGKEHRWERRFTLPVVCCSAVNHYTEACEVEEVWVWEQETTAR